MDWPYHPQLILLLSGLCVVVLGWNSGSLFALVLVAALLAPIVSAFLFIPYLLTASVLAALLALLPASRSARRR